MGPSVAKRRTIKHSIMIAGHKTSVNLEDAFWSALKEIAANRHMALTALVTEIDANRQRANLASAIRVFVLNEYLDQIADHDQTVKDREPTLVALDVAAPAARPCGWALALQPNAHRGFDAR